MRVLCAPAANTSLFNVLIVTQVPRTKFADSFLLLGNPPSGPERVDQLFTNRCFLTGEEYLTEFD